jgi:hypothetical protein
MSIKKWMIAAVLTALSLIFLGCNDEPPPKEDGGADDSWHVGFYNYPAGRVDQNGHLEISNSADANALLFDGTVDKEQYIGTIGPLGSVRVKLPEEKFYSIIAVQEEGYKDRGSGAGQFQVLVYYSNTASYAVTVSPSNAYGGGAWVLNNKTNFWVEIRDSGSGQIHVILPPATERIVIPIALNTPYDYSVCFKKELRYNGKTVAFAEAVDSSQADSIQVDDENPTHTTTLRNSGNLDFNIKPAVLVKNQTSKGLRLYYADQPKTNGEVDFVIRTASSHLVSGFEVGANVNAISFKSPSWGQDKRVPVDMVMKADKVYEITIPGSENASEITVVEAEASAYYD